ncbi:head decoration protein [Salinisphaera japonica]|uniref:Head decoration protein n=1 Tax=Salinisphaera japonica YTM-1 TaxID=1209778 RepID=A0A423Q129_9GAMM|nr:head decoration protein [Salinisphaera japonica]ROO31955.1 hypothetical protein SAJA_02045 [Salinisphaera japonica YTM-1]
MIVKEQTHAGEFMVSEANGSRSREQITIAYSKDLPPGTVLGKVNETGKYRQLDPAATDGSETPGGVLYDWSDASAGDRKAVAIVRDAEVVRASLAFADGMSQDDKNAALDALAERGVVSR